jgi:hypothetical protein
LKKIFSGLFSATFSQILPFYGLEFFPAMDNFLGPLLSYLAENSAIWQQWKRVPESNRLAALKLKINLIRLYLGLIFYPIKPSAGLFILIKSGETIP